MSNKKATALSIIALIFGASGLGYGFLLQATMQTTIQSIIYTKSGVQKSWFISDSGVKTTTSSTLELMEDMNLTVQVNEGESLYGDFRGNVNIKISDTTSAIIRFSIDGSTLDSHMYCFSDDYVSISLQVLRRNLTAGNHTIGIFWKITASGASPEAYCHKPTLLVQTIIE